MRPAGTKWITLPAKKPLFSRRKPTYPPTYPISYVNPSTIPRPDDDGITVEELNERIARRLKDDEEIEEKLISMKLELGLGSTSSTSATQDSGEPSSSAPQLSPEDMSKRIVELEHLLTASIKKNIRIEMERDRALENYKNIVSQMRAVLNQAQ